MHTFNCKLLSCNHLTTPRHQDQCPYIEIKSILCLFNIFVVEPLYCYFFFNILLHAFTFYGLPFLFFLSSFLLWKMQQKQRTKMVDAEEVG